MVARANGGKGKYKGPPEHPEHIVHGLRFNRSVALAVIFYDIFGCDGMGRIAVALPAFRHSDAPLGPSRAIGARRSGVQALGYGHFIYRANIQTTLVALVVEVVVLFQRTHYLARASA